MRLSPKGERVLLMFDMASAEFFSLNADCDDEALLATASHLQSLYGFSGLLLRSRKRDDRRVADTAQHFAIEGGRRLSDLAVQRGWDRSEYVRQVDARSRAILGV